MTMEPMEEKRIEWESHDIYGKWFQAVIDLNDTNNSTGANEKTLENLHDLLRALSELNPHFFKKTGYKIKSFLEFSREWGWGSSSTLISNLARLANIDPFELFFKTQKGSGYDIACARMDHPILYQITGNNPVYDKVDFHPPFHDRIGFIYSGNKQKTSESINQFLSIEADLPVEAEKITQITKEVAHSTRLADFCYFLTEHEKIISSLLHIKPVQEERFSDFKGTIKSLGAWGGDFIMAVSDYGMPYIRQYFRNKKLNIIFSFKEIVRYV